MTIPERLNYVLRKSYNMEYTMFNELIIKGPIKVEEMATIRRCLNNWRINYRNIVVE